jgi:hypothetical protein
MLKRAVSPGGTEFPHPSTSTSKPDQGDSDVSSTKGSTSGRSGTGTATALPVSRLRPAYQQVADQLRELILDGSLAPATAFPRRARSAATSG